MTVADAIDRAESIYKHNGRTERLIEWLSELEERIRAELFREERSVSLTLLSELTAPNAYAELYPLYLVMKSAFSEGEERRYNGYAKCFSAAYSEYIDHVNRRGYAGKTVYYKIL